MVKNTDVAVIVRSIISRVKNEGDIAVAFYTKKYDGISIKPGNFKVSEKETYKAIKKVSSDFLNTIKQAKENIEFFQKKIYPKSTIIRKKGIVLKHIFRPIEKVGIYIPGGEFAYPSTVLMTAIPAKVAGVKKIVMVSPSNNLTREVLATAKICGVDEIYRIGGAQAIAALAYGSKTIPKVDKIVGPGNVFVTEAKKQVFGEVGIDMLAGPSEVLVIADMTALPEFVIADLLAQCEHDKNAGAVLISLSGKLADTIMKSLRALAKQTHSDLLGQVKIIKVANIEQAIRIANETAAEHVEIMVKNPEKVAERIKNAGAIFMGNYSPVAIGDYFAGPSHVLPTGRTAKFSSSLSVYDFIKSSSVIHYQKSSLNKFANEVMKLARTEGLIKHADSIKVRFWRKSEKNKN
ncbi:MAG: histidinol dehydrogenase [Elusimicrobia bacterium]|nr:histidinol dehydrogenase [Elusimicrobiota bacterium]